MGIQALTLLFTVIIGYLVYDRCRLVRERDDARHQARHDPLTGLLNMRTFREIAKEQFELLVQNPHHLFAAVVIDLDEFGDLNNSLGHHIGDKYLQAFAGFLQTSLRSTDISCRWGGDEFVLLFPRTDEHHASMLVNILRKRMADIVLLADECPIYVKASFGYAQATPDMRSVEDLLKVADERMYADKARQRALRTASLELGSSLAT